MNRMDWETDVRHVLPSVSVPTLVLSREPDARRARYVAERIPGARYQEFPGNDSFYLVDYQDVIDSVRAFAEQPHAAPANAVLATLLFTDIVRSTELAAAQGDAAWRDLLAKHHAVVRAQLSRFRGVEIDTAGDGFFARFDGPARAIRCACAIRGALEEVGISVRAGLHTGECELLDGKVAGLAVSIGARVAARAEAGEVLVSQTVKDLVAGSGLGFDDRGIAELKGVPGEWHLYAVASDAP
jgi:class 3 adenylate cyclase